MKIAGDEKSTRYCFHDDIALLSWIPKKKKIYLVAQSFTRSSEIDARSGRRIVIDHYNNTKGGRDIFNKLCHSYSVVRGTKRWSDSSYVSYNAS